jgi:hypothetical protein
LAEKTNPLDGRAVATHAVLLHLPFSLGSTPGILLCVVRLFHLAVVGPPLLNFRRYYVMAPERLVRLDPGEAAKMTPDFLVDELAARLARAPVTFHLKVQLASPSDVTKDPSQPWPDSDEVVELGLLTIDKPVPDGLDAQKKLLFLPG